jgi:3-hydroxyisobutyryl-CoA hydrolase
MDSLNLQSDDSILIKTLNDNLTNIILNKPNKLNCLNTNMLKLLNNYYDSILNGTNKPPKYILLEGSGNSFCSGGDLKELYNYMIESKIDEVLDFYNLELKADYNIGQLPCRSIAIWNGYVMGGGVGLSINCNIRIASETTVFAMPETSIGLFPDVGASYFLPHYLGSYELALFVGLTGYRITGLDVVKSGIATHYIESSKVGKLKQELLETDDITQALENNCIAFGSNKAEEVLPQAEAIKKVFKLDSSDQIYSRLGEISNSSNNENEKKFAKETVDMLNKMSPLSMTIFLENLKKAQLFKSIEESYELDYKIFKK